MLRYILSPLKSPKPLKPCSRLHTVSDLSFSFFTMASRYASFTRCARSAMHNSSRRGSSSSFRPSNPKPTSFTNPSSASTRRRWAMSLIPLHNAVADAKLVSHLSVTSRNCSALALGLQGFIDAELHTFGVRSPRANRALSIVLDKAFKDSYPGFYRYVTVRYV